MQGMVKPKQKLCLLCIMARNDPHFTTPTHVGHPETREIGLFDVHGMAKCPICGAQWQRVRNVTKLVE